MAAKAKAKAKPVAKKKAAVKKTATAKKAAKATKAAKAQTTVTLRNLSDAIAEAHDLPKKQANAMLTEMISMITTHLKKGSRIRIGGLGILQVRHRPARMGRNPATGEAIKIKASKKIAFRAAKELKQAI
ncbi:MAG: HU family DNA-binding protein [Hyphomicrobiaceae bacterium]|nr:HU family DNA-binding protein [Hyphomicrobiaceae bacterium]MCC0007890.1 HU family DNA-binding protein [Hyphomicrobiaceae bacterium]